MRIILALILFGLSGVAFANVLPEDRADVMYKLYDGGGATIGGPSVLVRKQVAKDISMVANYYVDTVSSASIDVVTTASPYDEERTQWSVGMDYLRGGTTMSMNYVTSIENDFDANTYALGIQQTLLGQLTTISLNYSYGEDIVMRSDDETFARENIRQQYALGITQIITKHLIAALNIETVTDEGFLNNPYRTVRYVDPNSALGYSYEPELYPSTRTSNAFGLRAKYFLPYRAALEGEYRYFTDTWGIEGHTASIAYTHPWKKWIFNVKYRVHDQTGASFFKDLFSRSEATNFRGRDKELSPLTSNTIRLKASYEFLNDPGGWLKRGAVTASLDHMIVDYEEFRDLRVRGGVVGEEPLYSLDANVLQLWVSFWY
ncbi:MAG: DUF3570 domain-containing protein [Pseudomonadota bacterium]